MSTLKNIVGIILILLDNFLLCLKNRTNKPSFDNPVKMEKKNFLRNFIYNLIN